MRRTEFGALAAMFLALLVMSNGGSRAQTLSNVLEDLEKVRIVIGDLRDAAVRCGLTETDLRAAVYPSTSEPAKLVLNHAFSLLTASGERDD